MDETTEIIDRLYELPPAEFTAARNEAARELRKAGRREDAERVMALRKPTAAADAVNRLVRGHRADVEEFLHAAAALRDAQFAGKGDREAATRRERDALARLLAAGGEEVRQSLLAAAVDDDAARYLLEARLERELEPRGFGTLLAHAPAEGRRLEPARRRVKGAADPPAPAPTKPAGPKSGKSRPKAARAEDERQRPPRPKAATGGGRSEGASRQVAKRRDVGERRGGGERRDDAAARARLQDAKDELQTAEDELRAAEAEERQAHRHWEQTRRELDKTRAAVEKAHVKLDRLRGR